MRIQQNYLALNARRLKEINDNKTSKKITRLSSGYRINSAADDSAGLAISEKMRAQILGMNQAARNVMDGISLVQTVDGALQTITDIVQRMRELAVQSASDTNQTEIDRLALNEEYQLLKEEIDELVSNTTYNGVTPLAGESMQPTQNTLWRAEAVSPPEVDVEIPEYVATVPAQADTTGITTALSTQGTVGTVGTVSVSGTVGTVGYVSAVTDIDNLASVNVTSTAGTAVLASGSTLDINTAGTYTINANELISQGVTNINVVSGAKLIISGNITGNINIAGYGEVRIAGNAEGLDIGSNCSVQVTGSVTGDINNDGRITVNGSVTGNVTNTGTGYMTLGSVSGTVTNDGSMTVTGNASGDVINNSYMTIVGSAGNVTNGGSILIRGTVTQIENKSGATAELKNAANASITNYGTMELSNTSVGTNVTNIGSSAEIRVSSGGSGVTIASNTGLVDSYCNNTRVTSNSNMLRVSGNNAVITDNNGNMVVSGSYAAIEDNNGNMEVSGNGGTIKNNHSYMLVSGNSNTIENNNSGMLITGTNAKINGNSSNILATVAATGTIVNGNSSNIEIRGSDAIVNGNASNVLISGESALVNNNNGDVQISGQYARVENNSKNILLTGLYATVNNNNGDIEARAQYATVNDNKNNILLTGEYATINDNHGDIEARARYATINDNGSNTNNGNILITGSDAKVYHNHGSIVINANDVVVYENSNGGDIYSNVTLEVVLNLGRAFLQANGIIVGTNSGDMIIDGSSSVISNNYGKLEVNGTNTRVTNNYSTGNLEINGDDMWIGSNSGIVYADSERAKVDGNSGELKIDGNSAEVTNYASGKLRINGIEAKVTNWGLAHVVGNNLTITNNDYAIAKVEGNSTHVLYNGVGSRLDLDGSNGTVDINHGSAELNGSNSVVHDNTGHLRLETDNNATINGNSGRIEVSSGSVITKLLNQTGTILVEDDGRITDSNSINDGRIEVYTLAEIIINTNNGTVVSKGKSTMDINTGYLEIGEWIDDQQTPAAGSDSGNATVTQNIGGIIRNFSQNLVVDENISSPILVTNFPGCVCIAMEAEKSILGGIIENYGSMNVDCLNLAGPNMQGLEAEIYHHARQIDVSSIELDKDSTIVYVANGQIITLTGEWQSVLGGESGNQLFFDAKELDKGIICYSAGPDYEVSGVDYDIEERREVSGSVGTSGLTLMYKVGSGFYIQSGANYNDSMALDMKILNTISLATLPDNCGCIDCMCNLNTTNIKIQHTATCAIENCDQAINDISAYRGKLGAYQNRLEYKLHGLEISAENLTASESRIRDSDMAKESTELTRSQILTQASTAMLIQANSLPQAVLQILG